MMEKLTFLVSSKKRRLCKIIDSNGVIGPATSAAMFDSREKEVDFNAAGLREKHRLMRLFAKSGGALLRGGLKKKLKNERRRGLSESQAKTQSILFDFDNVELAAYQIPEANNAATVQLVAEQLISELPECFHDVSYIAQASSSFGMNKQRNKVSMHIHFRTTDPLAPVLLKEYLRYLNLSIPFFRDQVRLNPAGHTLNKKIDVCMYQPSRMVYIAYPHFMTADMNPFNHDDDRLILCEKEHHAATLTTELMNLDSGWIKAEEVKILRNFYKAEGKRFVQPKYVNIKGDNQQNHRVISNPEQAPMTLYGDHGEYCSFNLGVGDSHAYLVNKHSPAVVHNLKEGNYFLFEQCDPETYRWFVEEYLTEEKKNEDGEQINPEWFPIHYLERTSDSFHYGFYSPSENKLKEMQQTSHLKEMEDWYGNAGMHKPDGTRFITHRFDPLDKRTIDLDNGFINLFEPNELFLTPPEIKPEYCEATIETAAELLNQCCPIIYRCIRHIVNDLEEVGYFLNWLAYIFQRRDKTKTAYLLQGVPGTGKGVLYEKILIPLMGSHTERVRIKDLTSQFNPYVEQSLLLMMDEYKHTNAENHDALNAAVREIITEETLALRKMRENIRTVRTYCSLLMFSNEHDAVYIQNKDRRMNICPRQEIPILEIYPDWKKQVEEIPAELGPFSRFLQAFALDTCAATTPRENDAKKEMQELAMRSHDSFVSALATGDLMFFCDVLSIQRTGANDQMLRAAQNLVKAWVRDYTAGAEVKIFSSELMTLYSALIGEQNSLIKFGKILSRGGVKIKTQNRDGNYGKGIRLVWRINDIERQNLIRTSCDLPAGAFEPQTPRELPQ